jgi:hypothetical protein
MRAGNALRSSTFIRLRARMETDPQAARAARARLLPFGDAANLAWALVCFARRVRCKFAEREQRLIAIAVQQRLAPQRTDIADVIEWLKVGLPEAWLFYELSLADYANRLTPAERLLAHQAAWSMARGSGRRFVPDDVADAIETFFAAR